MLHNVMLTSLSSCCFVATVKDTLQSAMTHCENVLCIL